MAVPPRRAMLFRVFRVPGCGMNFHDSLRSDYGKDCLNNVRLLERNGKKIARFRNHLRFSLHCKHLDITPVSLRLSSTVKGNKANNILRSAERALLNVRVGQIVNKINNLNQEKQRLENIVLSDSSTLPDTIKEEVKSRTGKSQLKEHEVSKVRQQKKFSRLLEHKNELNSKKLNNNLASECISKWVKHCSQRILNDPELSVLAKGLNYAVAPNKFPVVDIITSTETACRNLSERDRGEEELKAVDNLKKDKDIRILPADKGRIVVVLDTVEYQQKCEQLLGDTTTYTNLGTKDPTTKYKKQLVSVLQELGNEGAINRDEYRKLYPTTESPPKFYGLPKVHKKDIPLRPIVHELVALAQLPTTVPNLSLIFFHHWLATLPIILPTRKIFPSA
ncbi:uncharacterized protein [Amphiura filiformis]|uniref:uncharacterized protein n=1 Tax=Amphiura filiformis TaxID=82378 RepID=UPI003B2156C6